MWCSGVLQGVHGSDCMIQEPCKVYFSGMYVNQDLCMVDRCKCIVQGPSVMHSRVSLVHRNQWYPCKVHEKGYVSFTGNAVVDKGQCDT